VILRNLTGPPLCSFRWDIYSVNFTPRFDVCVCALSRNKLATYSYFIGVKNVSETRWTEDSITGHLPYHVHFEAIRSYTTCKGKGKDVSVYAIKVYMIRRYSSTRSYPQDEMRVSLQLHVPVALPWDKITPRTRPIWGWVSTRPGLAVCIFP
jgi:hypothetical protein